MLCILARRYKTNLIMPFQRVIIEPRKAPSEHDVPPTAIMACVRADMNLVRRHMSEVVSSQDQIAGRILECRAASGNSLALAGPVLGAPQAVVLLEKLIALGAQYIFCMGWCGSIVDSVAIGDLVIVQSALSEEGTSVHYPVRGKKVEASGLLIRLLIEALERRSCPFHMGKVWSTDAIFRETEEKVRSYAANGILAVDMEMSALFKVGIFRGVQVAGLLVVSDELGSLKWSPGFRSPKFKQARTLAARIILESCLALDRSDMG
jgi:uridine phosphorylase